MPSRVIPPGKAEASIVSDLSTDSCPLVRMMDCPDKELSKVIVWPGEAALMAFLREPFPVSSVLVTKV